MYTEKGTPEGLDNSNNQNSVPMWWMLKQPGLKSWSLHQSVLLCNCWTYEGNIGPKFKKAELCNFGGVKCVGKISSTA